MTKAEREMFENLNNRINILEEKIQMRDPYINSYMVGGPEDQIRRQNVGVAVYAILKHLKLYPATIVRCNEITLDKWV